MGREGGREGEDESIQEKQSSDRTLQGVKAKDKRSKIAAQSDLLSFKDSLGGLCHSIDSPPPPLLAWLGKARN